MKHNLLKNFEHFKENMRVGEAVEDGTTRTEHDTVDEKPHDTVPICYLLYSLTKYYILTGTQLIKFYNSTTLITILPAPATMLSPSDYINLKRY